MFVIEWFHSGHCSVTVWISQNWFNQSQLKPIVAYNQTNKRATVCAHIQITIRSSFTQVNCFFSFLFIWIVLVFGFRSSRNEGFYGKCVFGRTPHWSTDRYVINIFLASNQHFIVVSSCFSFFSVRCHAVWFIITWFDHGEPNVSDPQT